MRAHLLLLLALACGCQQSEAPQDPDADVQAADLRPRPRPDMARGVKLAIVHAGDGKGAAGLREALAALGGFQEVLVYDAGAGTPDALLLVSYDALLVYSVGPFKDPEALGDRLAEYFQGGGGVVLGMLTTVAKGDPLYPNLYVGGHFRSDGDYALLPDSGFHGRDGPPVGLGKIDDPQSPLVAGLTSFSGGADSFRPRDKGTSPGATVIAEWADGTPLLVRRTVMGRPRVDLGFFPPPDFDRSGQNWTAGGDILIRNALLQVARR